MENKVERKHRYGKNHRKEKSKKSHDKKKPHKKPHSLMNKHETDPSDLLDQKTTRLDSSSSGEKESSSSSSSSSSNEKKSVVVVEKIESLPVSDNVPVSDSIDSAPAGKSDPVLESVPVLEKIESVPVTEVVPIPVAKLEPTSEVHLSEFYGQLQFLDEFFRTHQIKYWLNGGTLLGQVRNEKLIPWADCNSIGMSEADGKSCFRELKKSAEKAGYQLWNSVHGLKLRRSKLISPVATDIYYYTFYPQANNNFILSSLPSRKQWPKDYFKEEELNALNVAPFGPLMLWIPTNPTRYLATLYGEDFLSVARYSSYNHFSGEPRKSSITFIKIEK